MSRNVTGRSSTNREEEQSFAIQFEWIIDRQFSTRFPTVMDDVFQQVDDQKSQHDAREDAWNEDENLDTQQ